jgi:hypothetical protein
MARGKMSKAKCQYCKEDFTTISIAKHLNSCSKHLEAIKKAESGKLESENLYYVRAYERYIKDFWLELEIKGSAKMKDLDHYLRAIWLECCGHLSEFSADGWGSPKIAMTKKVSEVFDKYAEITHIYDFGSESQTAIKFISKRQGKPLSKHSIELMARNLTPEVVCRDCEEIANWLCVQCLYDTEDGGLVCQKHYKKHKSHDEYGDILELVNSPRLGTCGYDGPAEPPY